MVEPDIRWLDERGRQTDDPRKAVAAEIQEFDAEGVPTTRTYARIQEAVHIDWASTQEEIDVVLG